ncbi:hypothetical protein Tco_1351407 [Tanacetum coccineum]
MPTEMELTLEQTQQGVSYEVSIQYTAGNPVKNILLNKILYGHRLLTDGCEVPDSSMSFTRSIDTAQT